MPAMKNTVRLAWKGILRFLPFRSPFVFLLAIHSLSIASSFAVPLRGAEWEDRVASSLASITEKFGVPVVIRDPGFPVRISTGVIDGKESKPERAMQYASIFVPEFSRYPVEFVRRTGLKRIVLCEALSFSGQLRTALPDFENQTLYLDIARGANNTVYARTVIHHEFFHLVDYADDGNVYRDEEWASLNPSSFRYGDGGKNAQSNRNTSVLTNRYPGFLNHYSTTGVEEDKAEIFANLIIRPAYLETAVQTDPLLASKVTRMKRLLSRFSKDLDESFWTAARNAAAP
ncbi:hypothetical protein VN12_03770 [Pirellula sp. SH-Sr6A]|uniref:hypothetical protein n=1 Tax=Pirellula sp. SH-Sr6A TaxID=1632865 RepID=UPI00078CE43D|nr:hypothetical protein [Pirellula sp. SH-Sr6A]AMV31211.1 hypothetical protein VN12_03770 [Pirellula sp. SH-Sr6A]